MTMGENTAAASARVPRKGDVVKFRRSGRTEYMRLLMDARTTASGACLILHGYRTRADGSPTHVRTVTRTVLIEETEIVRGGTDVITAEELDRMPRTEGTCTVCGEDTLVYALDEFTCRKCALNAASAPMTAGRPERAAMAIVNRDHAAELARPREAMEAALPATDEASVHDGATWYADGPTGGPWVIRWHEQRGTVSAWQSGTKGVKPRFRGDAAGISDARREAARIAALIAAGKTRED